MNKLNIILGILVIVISGNVANAKYSDYYRVFHDGVELNPGDTVYCYDFQEIEIKHNVRYNYETSIQVINQLEESNINWAKLTYADSPTEEEGFSDKDFWGTLALCYYGGDANGEMASCMSPNGSAVRIPNNKYDCFEWHPQLQYASPQCRSSYTFILKAAFGELAWGNYEIESDSEFYITIEFLPNDLANITSLDIKDQEPEVYYDLRGNLIKSPQKGLYIVKRGNSYYKEFFIK